MSHIFNRLFQLYFAMKRSFIITLGIGCLFITSCALPYFYQPVEPQPDSRSSLMYTHGIPSLHKRVDSVDVFADLTSRGEYMYSLTLGFVNQSEQVVTFYPDQVRAYGIDAAGRKVNLRVFTAEQFIRRENTRQALIAGAIVVATVATAVAVAEAVDDDGGGSIGDGPQNNNFFIDDSFWWWATLTPTVVVNTPRQTVVPVRPGNLLRRHSMVPGESLQGIIKIQAQQPLLQKVMVEVPLNGITSTFVYGARQRLR
jgi:hypothetical protein